MLRVPPEVILYSYSERNFCYYKIHIIFHLHVGSFISIYMYTSSRWFIQIYSYGSLDRLCVCTLLYTLSDNNDFGSINLNSTTFMALMFFDLRGVITKILVILNEKMGKILITVNQQ